MEIWDAYNEKGEKIGKDLIRGEVIPDGLFHLVVEIIVTHTDGTYLLLKRAYTKTGYPGFWEIGAGGSALKGEDAVAAAMRELFEESGIKSKNLNEIYRVLNRKNKCIYVGFLTIVDNDKTNIILQEGETIDYRWIKKSELIEFFYSKDCMDGQQERLKEYIDTVK